LTEFCTGRSM